MVRINEEVVRNVARYCKHEITPLCSFFGGIVAQECVKLSGRFTPIRQWFHFDIFDSIPDIKEIDQKP